MNPTRWTPDRGGEPRRTARLLRWYRCRIAQWFNDGQEKTPIDAALLAGLIEWFAERPEFLRWRVYDDYRGTGYAAGFWSLHFAAMKPALAGAIKEVEAEQRRRLRETWGPITEAVVDAALARLEGPSSLPDGLPAEPFAGHLYADLDAAMPYYENRNKIHCLGIRACRKCGESFKPTARKRRTCPECLAAAKVERELGQGLVT